MPFTLFDRLTGLTATDAFIQTLAQISRRPVPARLRRQLVDAMLDAHFHVGNVKVAIAVAAAPDLLTTHSHGRKAAERRDKPLFRIGMPMFDRIGNAHLCHVGYRGTRARSS